MKTLWALVAWLAIAAAPLGLAAKASAQPSSGGQAGISLWDLAKTKAETHRFSTLFTAQDVRDHLSTEDGIAAAIDWCRKTGVTKVYIEAFRDGYQAKREALQHAKQRFQAAGFEVSGCVTTTGVGKRSTRLGAAFPATRTRPPRSGSSGSSSTPPGCSTRS